MAASVEVEVETAALMVAVIRAGELEAAAELYEWYANNFGASERLEELSEEI